MELEWGVPAYKVEAIQQHCPLGAVVWVRILERPKRD